MYIQLLHSYHAARSTFLPDIIIIAFLLLMLCDNLPSSNN